jgi:hypothetical protein
MEEVQPSARIPHGLVESNFISPIDGSVITSQRKLHDHNMRNGVTQVNPEIEHIWGENRKKREDFYTGDRLGAPRRREAIIRALEKHRG